MSTISKERVKDILEFGAGRIISPITDGEIMELARIALASLEAEAVSFVMADDLKDSSIISTPAYRDLGEAVERTVGDVVALYAAPPASVTAPKVPSSVTAETCNLDELGHDWNEAEYYAQGWNACRAAMLQGAGNSLPLVESKPFSITSVFKPQRVSEDEVDCDNCAHYQPNVCHGEGCPAAILQGGKS